MSEDTEIISSSNFLKDTDVLITQLDAERIEKKKETFITVLNSNVLNAVNQITSTASGVQQGTIMELVNSTNGNVTVKLYYDMITRNKDNKKLQLELTPNTAKLFMLYRWKFTQTNNKEVMIPLKDYCELTGSIQHRAKEKLEKDTALLLNMKMTVEHKDSKGVGILNANLFESSYLLDDRIILKCTDVLKDCFTNSSPMPYPLPLLRIPCNSKQYPYVFVVGTKLYELYKMNMYDKKNKDKKDHFFVSIRTLLEVCYLNGMKTPEQLKEEAQAKNGKVRYSQFIVTPFLDTITLLEGTYPDKPKKKKTDSATTEDKRPELKRLIKITYCNSKREPLEQEYNGNFTEWITGFLKVEFIPEYDRPEYDIKKARRITAKKERTKVRTPKKGR